MDYEISPGDSMKYYSRWPEPTVIISDGPYGVGGYPGDFKTPRGLAEFYEAHIEMWTKYATRQTTLWFWNTEIGWAKVQPTLERYGWRYKSCHIWDKGIGHIAGNVNGKSIKKLPIVTEVCVQYSFEPKIHYGSQEISLGEWLRAEWKRTGLPLNKTNEVCGVKDAATRKYFTTDEHLWYMPPVESFVKLAEYANRYGEPKGVPYFSMDGARALCKEDWVKMRPKFNYKHGHTNVWSVPPLRNGERLKNGSKSIHLNQKPLSLMKLIIELSSDENDVIWEPFGGLCSGLIAAIELGRKAYAAEISEEVYLLAQERLKGQES